MCPGEASPSPWPLLRPLLGPIGVTGTQSWVREGSPRPPWGMPPPGAVGPLLTAPWRKPLLVPLGLFRDGACRQKVCPRAKWRPYFSLMLDWGGGGALVARHAYGSASACPGKL